MISEVSDYIQLYIHHTIVNSYTLYIANYYYDHGRAPWEDILIIDRSSHEFLFTKTVCWDRALFSPIFCARFVYISVRNYCQPLLHFGIVSCMFIVIVK